MPRYIYNPSTACKPYDMLQQDLSSKCVGSSVTTCCRNQENPELNPCKSIREDFCLSYGKNNENYWWLGFIILLFLCLILCGCLYKK